jgi:hypothetical protein
VKPEQRKSGSGRAPSFVTGRRGGISVVDALVRSLWQETSRRDVEGWPSKTFGTLATEASSIVGYQLTPSTVRSAIYGRIDLFEKDEQDGALRWRLSKKARTA